MSIKRYTYEEVQQLAQAKGHRIERGNSGRYHDLGDKPTGYRLWRRGLWRYCATLKEVVTLLEKSR